MQHTWVNATDAAIDERLGLISTKLNFTLSPGLNKVATLQHALKFVPDEVRTFGLPLVKRDVKERQDGGYDIGFLVEGVFSPDTADGEEFSLDGSTTDEKIEAHPELEMLVAKYFPEGTTLRSAQNADGRIIFPATLEVNGQVMRNPLHGTESFLLPGMIWTRSRVLAEFPPDLANQLGKAGTPPRGRLGQTAPDSGGPDWIMARLKADWRGNVWKVTDSWLNSGKNGFPPDLYRYT